MNMTEKLIDETLLFMYKETLYYYLPEFVKGFEYTPWIFSLLGSALIGLSGILPLAIIPSTEEESKEKGFKDRDTNIDLLQNSTNSVHLTVDMLTANSYNVIIRIDEADFTRTESGTKSIIDDIHAQFDTFNLYTTLYDPPITDHRIVNITVSNTTGNKKHMRTNILKRTDYNKFRGEVIEKPGIVDGLTTEKVVKILAEP